MSAQKEFDGIEAVMEESLKGRNYDEVRRILYGRAYPELELSQESKDLAVNGNFELKAYSISAQAEQLRAPRRVRITAIQNSIVLATTAPVCQQRKALHEKISVMIEVAALADANIVCLQEAWTMPFAFCTRERLPWTEFAESAEGGPTTQFLSQLAAKYGIVIISPILERDDEKDGVIWNTAVVISHTGKVIGKSRKNHIPRVGDFNESSYYMESTLGHPVFETAFGKIGINICYGRHHPQNWMMYALNGAEIIFNPSATVGELSEPLWGIEARNAAIANHCFTVAINRVGTEYFPNEFTSGDGRPGNTALLYFCRFITIPFFRGLSRTRDGVLIAEVDLNLCRQTKDTWGFRMTQRLDLYAKSLEKAARPDYRPDIRREK
uniref:Beta-ureidopropionase n=1 Tax=Angiostrongylus cantonensis TaxID=6313 RepID=A0A0K0DAQ5_ANGCA